MRSVRAKGAPDGSLQMNVGDVDSVMFSDIVPIKWYGLEEDS
jgi:hypothetical protein